MIEKLPEDIFNLHYFSSYRTSALLVQNHMTKILREYGYLELEFPFINRKKNIYLMIISYLISYENCISLL